MANRLRLLANQTHLERAKRVSELRVLTSGPYEILECNHPCSRIRTALRPVTRKMSPTTEPCEKGFIFLRSRQVAFHFKTLIFQSRPVDVVNWCLRSGPSAATVTGPGWNEANADAGSVAGP